MDHTLEQRAHPTLSSLARFGEDILQQQQKVNQVAKCLAETKEDRLMVAPGFGDFSSQSLGPTCSGKALWC